MIIDQQGFRLNIGIVLANGQGHLFWGRRIGHDTWQFPQGGVHENETPEQTMYRELREEIGLEPNDVAILAETKEWYRYRLPDQFVRQNSKPMVVGQKQKWFLLHLLCSEQKLRLNLSHSPEFDSWRWVDYWRPSHEVIYFKRQVYRRVLQEFAPVLRVETH